MKISCDKGHPDFKWFAWKAGVRIDGEINRFCTHADEELGQVTVLATDSDGKVKYDKSHTAIREIKHGVVEIYFPNERIADSPEDYAEYLEARG